MTVKFSGRQRFILSFFLLAAGLGLVGGLIYETTYASLRQAYHALLERNVQQGAAVIENYLRNQFSLLSLYAQVPSVREGRFSDLPVWLTRPTSDGIHPKRLAIIDIEGRGLTTGGERFDVPDRPYFRQAQAGQRAVVAPLLSRVDGIPAVVLAEPVPGNHPEAAALTATYDLTVLKHLLASFQGFDDTELTLTSGTSLLASLAPPQGLGAGEFIEARQDLSSVPWTLKARVRVADLLQPVRTVLVLVGVLLVVGALMVLGVFYFQRRHREEFDQLREDRTQALRDAYEQIRKLAYYDTVTRLPNRNLVLRHLSEALQEGRDLQVVVVALSRFRSFTATFGLHFGDSLVKEAARRLGPAAEGGFLGRVGTSEFLLLRPTPPGDDGDLEALVNLFQEPMGPEDLRLQVGVHLGACRLLEAGSSPEEVVKSAETALWAARDRGPNEASLLTAEAVAHRSRRARVQSLLPDALGRGELEVHFQAQVDPRTGTVAGYEALLRWHSAHLGRVSPDEFIPLAEETGFIVPLGYWVLDQSIAFARLLEAAGSTAVVSVNVSPVQFLHHDFLEGVHQRIGDAGLPPWRLGLEITESGLIGGLDLLRPSLARLMDAGIKVSLDDFGTGYSSFTYLKDLPLHVLKIDKSFVAALDLDCRALRLVECIIDLAHHLDLTVVAEGIETEAQLACLTEVGCDLIQGFLTGKPRPAGDHLAAAAAV